MLISGVKAVIIPPKGGIRLPTYDYKCTKCGHEFAVEQSILDKPLTRCRKCRGRLQKQLPRRINLIFKGSGFYATDYKKTKAGGKPASASDGNGGGKSESKPAEKKSKAAKA
jgi:putative FmdB family regulatory protein